MLKRLLFLAVTGIAAFLEGWCLGPLGADLLAYTVVITIVLAIGWMRTYWDAPSKAIDPCIGSARIAEPRDSVVSAR
jgi:hypothetical protein